MTTLVHRPKKTGDGSISFPNLQCWNPDTETATIAAQHSGERVSCRIRFSDLRRKYNCQPGDPMLAVTRYRFAIEEAARKLIESKRFEKDGSILIDYSDL